MIDRNLFTASISSEFVPESFSTFAAGGAALVPPFVGASDSAGIESVEPLTVAPGLTGGCVAKMLGTAPVKSVAPIGSLLVVVGDPGSDGIDAGGRSVGAPLISA